MARFVKVKAHHAVDKAYWVGLGSQPDHGAVVFSKLTVNHIQILQEYTNVETKEDFKIVFDVEGTNFQFAKIGGEKVPVRGTIKEITVSVDEGLGPDIKIEFSKISISVTEAGKWWLSGGDPLKAFDRLLQGRTDIEGSDENDKLLFGGIGNDKINGMGGSDHVNGGKGDDVNDGGLGLDFLDDVKGYDTFQFTTLFALGNEDTIKKFSLGDRIYLDLALVGDKIGEKLNANEFAIGDAAIDANDHVIWDPTVRTAYWDPDGNGGIDPIPIFLTVNEAKVTHKSFAIGLMYE